MPEARQPSRQRLLVFNDPKPIRVDRLLAQEIGLENSMVFLQLEYLLSTDRDVRWIRDRPWVAIPLPELQRDHFPFWSVRTLERIFLDLKKRGLIEVGKVGGFDRTNVYSLGPQVPSLDAVKLASSIPRNGGMHAAKLAGSKPPNWRDDMPTDWRLHEEEELDSKKDSSDMGADPLSSLKALFDWFWDTWPAKKRQGGKMAAWDLFRKAVPPDREDDFRKAVLAYLADTTPQYVKWITNFLKPRDFWEGFIHLTATGGNGNGNNATGPKRDKGVTTWIERQKAYQQQIDSSTGDDDGQCFPD